MGKSVQPDARAKMIDHPKPASAYQWLRWLRQLHCDTSGAATLETIALAAIVAIFFIALLTVMDTRGFAVISGKMNTNLDCQISLWRSGSNSDCGPSGLNPSNTPINNSGGSDELIGGDSGDLLGSDQDENKCKDYELNFEKRTEAYQLINQKLQTAGSFAKEVKFFKAAEDVVDAFSPFDDNNDTLFTIPGIDLSVPELDPVSVETELFSQRLSQYLFEHNKKVADQLLQSPNTLILPGTENRIARSPLEWDLAMVQYEQKLAENFIKEQLAQGCISSKNLTEITQVLQKKWWYRLPTATLTEFTHSTALTMAQEWAEKQKFTLDYTKLDHRIAIGAAAIFELHKLDNTQYESYLDNRDRFLDKFHKAN